MDFLFCYFRHQVKSFPSDWEVKGDPRKLWLEQTQYNAKSLSTLQYSNAISGKMSNRCLNLTQLEFSMFGWIKIHPLCTPLCCFMSPEFNPYRPTIRTSQFCSISGQQIGIQSSNFSIRIIYTDSLFSEYQNMNLTNYALLWMVTHEKFSYRQKS